MYNISPYLDRAEDNCFIFFEYISRMGDNAVELFKLNPMRLKKIDSELYQFILDNLNWTCNGSGKTYNNFRLLFFMKGRHYEKKKIIKLLLKEFEIIYSKQIL